MSNEAADDRYQQTHTLLDAARTAVAGDETKKALLLIIEAVESSTFGWGEVSNPDDDRAAARAPDLDAADKNASRLPDLRTIVIQGSNCVSILNEHAQKHDLVQPSYTFLGAGPFLCRCSFMDNSTSSDSRRTKMESKHDAAERMLNEIRGNH